MCLRTQTQSQKLQARKTVGVRVSAHRRAPRTPRSTPPRFHRPGSCRRRVDDDQPDPALMRDEYDDSDSASSSIRDRWRTRRRRCWISRGAHRNSYAAARGTRACGWTKTTREKRRTTKTRGDSDEAPRGEENPYPRRLGARFVSSRRFRLVRPSPSSPSSPSASASFPPRPTCPPSARRAFPPPSGWRVSRATRPSCRCAALAGGAA